MENIALLFDQVSGRWLRFENPETIITTSDVDRVVNGIKDVEKAVDNGYYAAGFMSYEAACAFDSALSVKALPDFPLCWFGIYKNAASVDPARYRRKKYRLGDWDSSIDRERYNRDIDRIKEYIAAGQTYQVNYTYRLFSAFSGDSLSFFLDLSGNQPTEYAAYFDTGDFSICSASPELFFRLNGTGILSKPMKGTSARGRFLSEDEERAAWLSRSPKNRAENVMIVDMIRNDLGRIAAVDSVRVTSLYDIERYPTAYQMTSTVAAVTDAPFGGIMAALFPCASVTGAPKPRTMKIISELETTPRKIYSGCLGFITPQGAAQFNVAIRTALIDRKEARVEYGVGGGIVWESDAKDEFVETRTKAKVLQTTGREFQLLETMLWTPREGLLLLDYHLKRLRDSARYFDFAFDENETRALLNDLVSIFSDKSYRVRLLLDVHGKSVCQHAVICAEKPVGPVKLAVSTVRVNSSEPLLYHKTTCRRIYEEAKKSAGDCDDAVLLNERGEVTETCIHNIIIKVRGELLTPPVISGLLPGTYRAWLLDRGEIREKAIELSDLSACDGIYVVNSVNRCRKAVLCPDAPV